MPRGGRRPITIGALLRSLTAEFPDLTISKIRYLEAEGLLRPTRTASGYRTYTPQDQERLAFILRAQRDRFWPLKVIAEALDAMDRGLEAPDGPGSAPLPPAPVVDPQVPTAGDLSAPRRLRLTAAEVASASGADPSLVETLASFGLVRTGTDGHYDDADLAIAAAAATLAGFGLEARHLRTFRTAADREIGLAEQVLAIRDGATREEDLAEIVRACIALHAALVRAGLRQRHD